MLCQVRAVLAVRGGPTQYKENAVNFMNSHCIYMVIYLILFFCLFLNLEFGPDVVMVNETL